MCGNRVDVDPHTEHVCIVAVNHFREHSPKNTLIILPAGYSKVYDATASVAMRNCILSHGLHHDDVQTLESPEYGPVGETVAAARYLTNTFPRREVSITIVVRSFQAKRAEALLRHFLEHDNPYYEKLYSINVVKVRRGGIHNWPRELGARLRHGWRSIWGYKFKSTAFADY